MKLLSIGALAQQTGVKVPTIRYYESVGLVPDPHRTPSNRRTYGPETVRRLRFIRHARELGFEIDVVRQLLALSDDPNRPCNEADVIAREHLADIDDKIARLTALRAEVTRMIAQCELGKIKDCQIIEALAAHREQRRDERDRDGATP